MAKKNRLSIDFKGFQEYYEKLDKLGGDIKKTTEDALIASHNYITDKIEPAIESSKLPAKGKYAHGDNLKNSIVKTTNVEWNGTRASIKVGFDLKQGGLTSIFLMYGTPRMQPVKGLKAVIYGAKTKKERRAIQKEIFENAIARRMGT